MVVKAPIDGIVLPLEQLPDETFAAAILGPGCGIEPTGDTAVSYTHLDVYKRQPVGLFLISS